jgi:hypothetical protein
MDELERLLRSSAEQARATAATACIDVDDDLAATLDRARHVSLARPNDVAPNRGRRVALLAAAVLIAGVAAGIVLIARHDNTKHVLTPVEPTDEPTTAPTSITPTTAAPTTTPSVLTTTTPTTGASGPTASAASCGTELSPETVASQFANAMVAARDTGDFALVAACLDSIPAAFTGVAPACWTVCEGTQRTFGLAAMTTSEVTSADGTTSWYNSLPVTYRAGDRFTDVWESWQVRSSPTGYDVTDFSVTEPPFDRANSLATIVEYFGHIERGEWTAAAAMLNDGALEPEARPDLQQLAPATFNLDDIAAALENWCRDGCDTTPPTADELAFTGAFSLTRADQKISVRWYEGAYSIFGLPIR